MHYLGAILERSTDIRIGTGASTADFKLLLRSVTTKLKTLIACGNDIKAVGTAIAPLTKLKTLNLSGCSIEYLTYHVCPFAYASLAVALLEAIYYIYINVIYWHL